MKELQPDGQEIQRLQEEQHDLKSDIKSAGGYDSNHLYLWQIAKDIRENRYKLRRLQSQSWRYHHPED